MSKCQNREKKQIIPLKNSTASINSSNTIRPLIKSTQSLPTLSSSSKPFKSNYFGITTNNSEILLINKQIESPKKERTPYYSIPTTETSTSTVNKASPRRSSFTRYPPRPIPSQHHTSKLHTIPLSENLMYSSNNSNQHLQHQQQQPSSLQPNHEVATTSPYHQPLQHYDTMPLPHPHTTYPHPLNRATTISSPTQLSHPPDLRTHFSEGDHISRGINNNRLNSQGDGNEITRANSTNSVVKKGWNPSWKSNENRTHMNPIEEAIRASKNDAEIDRVRRESEIAEEARLYALALSYSAEQNELRALRLLEEEEVEEKALREAIILSKGKSRETLEERMEREEREEMEIVMALSLSETKIKREGGGETSAEAFERLSQPTTTSTPENEFYASTSHTPTISIYSNSQEPVPSTSTSHSLPPSKLERRPTSFFVANPDLDPDDAIPPPAYSPEDYQIHENPRTVVLGPETSLPISHTPSIVRRLPTPTPQSQPQPVSIPSPVIPIPTPHPQPALHELPPNSSQSLSRIYRTPTIPTFKPVETKLNQNAASFYSPQVAAARLPKLSTSTSNLSLNSNRISVPELYRTLVEDNQDPFDEDFAAVESTSEDFSDEEEPTIVSESRSSLQLPSTAPTSAYRNSSSSLLLPIPLPSPTPSEIHGSRGSSPSFGGLVVTSNVNADPDEAVLIGIKFGFIDFNRRHLHPLLEFEGSFPDVAQLSGNEKGLMEGGGNGKEFKCFAIEAGSWSSLLTYLMWHGNSHIEAAPSDLESDKLGKGLSCRITIEFFRSFLDSSERVRCRIDLIPPLHIPTSPTLEEPFAHFDPDCPNISIRLPQTPYLPLTLSNLAITLSNAHTLSRQYNHNKSSSSVFNSTHTNQFKVLKNLSLAIDLFKKLRGETNLDNGDSNEEEENVLTRLKLRLKRRKKVIGIIDRTGEGQIIPTGGLPEGAVMITPFRLEQS